MPPTPRAALVTAAQALLLGLGVFSSGLAAAGEGEERPEVSVSGQDDLEFRYWRDDRTLPDFPEEDHLFDYWELVNRVNVKLDRGPLQLGVQLDAVGMLGAYYYLNDVRVDEFDLHADGVTFPLPLAYANLDKAWLGYQGDSAQLLVGDGYIAFGRGLALSLVKNTNIDIDSSLRGAHAKVTLGAWDLTAVSGVTNAQQVWQDNPNKQQIRPDHWHMVSGLRIDRYGLGPLNLGAHSVVYSFADRADLDAQPWEGYGRGVDAAITGASVEAFGVAGLDLFAEGDLFLYPGGEVLGVEDNQPGYAVYGSAAAYPGRVALLVEGKHYKDVERVNAVVSRDLYEVAVGPTLEYERVITEDSGAAVNSNDISGVRLRADVAAKPGVLTPSLTLGLFRDRELGGLHFNRAPETIVHPIAGVDWIADSVHVLANAGFRVDKRDDLPGGVSLGADRMAHVDLSLGFPIGSAHGEIGGDLRYFMWGDNLNQQTDFTLLTANAAVHLGHGVSIVGYTDWTDDPLIDSVGNINENLYAAGELQLQPADGMTFKLFYGAYRAGIRCAGGQCRMLPGFDGARLSATINF
ncbi:hypothetical protein L6R49_21230 [Myxococcota bacterium]|nr:hypothetical protein [Myxococcota bacterium]